MYQKLIGTSSPGLFVILVDQSGSMVERYDNSTRAEFAALAVNRTIYEIIASCRKGEKVVDHLSLAIGLLVLGLQISPLFTFPLPLLL